MRQPAHRAWPTLQQWRRRWFLGALLAGGALGWLARVDAAVGERALSVSSKVRARATLMPKALPVFIDHLIPADELTPAASALSVPQAIWHEALNDPELKAFIEGGCVWLDRYGEGFATLSEDEREALCQWMSKASWDGPQRRFFHWVRERAFTLYYMHPAAWRGMPFDRPPQPIGFTQERGA